MFFLLSLFICSTASIYCASSDESATDCQKIELAMGTLSVTGDFASGKYAACLHSKADLITGETAVVVAMAKSDAYKSCKRIAKHCIKAIGNTETDDIQESISASLKVFHKNNLIMCVCICERHKIIFASCIDEKKKLSHMIDEYGKNKFQQPHLLSDLPVALSSNSDKGSAIPRISLNLKNNLFR